MKKSYFDERKCPVCGKRFIMRCRPDEWGCAAQGGEYGRRVSRVLLCSIPCMKKQAETTLAKSAEKVKSLRSWQAWRMVNIDGYPPQKVAKEMGITTAQVTQFAGQIDLFYWQEAEWLVRNGATA